MLPWTGTPKCCVTFWVLCNTSFVRSNGASAIQQKQESLLVIVCLMCCGDFCGHIDVKLFHPSCQKTGLRPPVFDCLLGHFHRAFLSDSGKLPCDYLGRTNEDLKLQNLFASYVKTKPVYNEILLTTLGKSFCLGSRGDRASKAHRYFACFWELECQLM